VEDSFYFWPPAISLFADWRVLREEQAIKVTRRGAQRTRKLYRLSSLTLVSDHIQQLLGDFKRPVLCKEKVILERSVEEQKVGKVLTARISLIWSLTNFSNELQPRCHFWRRYPSYSNSCPTLEGEVPLPTC
jgi:hypothetical protein